VTPFAQSLAEERSQLALPPLYGFMGQHDATLEEHFGKVPQAELVPEAPQHHQADHIGGILQAIERRAGPFVKPLVTGPTAKAAVPQLRPIRAFSGSGRPTMRACHGFVLLSEARVYMRCQRK
jgi:hypothetical protein